MSNEGEGRPRARWGLVVVVTLLGAAVIGVPFYLTEKVDPGFGTARSLTSTALINVGTTLLLAALLVWLGRSFVTRAERAARRVVEETTEQLRQETSDIRQRLDALQDRVDERTASAEAAGAAVADDIVSDVSFETVTKALELANDVDALWHSAITVPTNDSVDAPAVRLSWTATQRGGRFDDLDNVVATLEIVYEHHSEQSNSRFDLEWLPGVPADQILHELKESMVRADYGEAAQALDTKYMFERFGHGISDAIAGKRAQPDAWLKGCGALDELVGADLAITSLGVAARGYGLVFKASEFSQRPLPAMSAEQRASGKPYKLPKPPAPEGIDPEHWAVAIARAAEHHPPVRRQGLPALRCLWDSRDVRELSGGEGLDATRQPENLHASASSVDVVWYQEFDHAVGWATPSSSSSRAIAEGGRTGAAPGITTSASLRRVRSVRYWISRSRNCRNRPGQGSA